MNLCIDIGNTNAKAGIFDHDKLVKVKHQLTDREVLKLIKDKTPNHVLISSVRRGIGRLVQSSEAMANTLVFNHNTPIPFTNKYQTPQTLGLDRLAAVAGAQFLYSKTNCLIVDIGTCITYDVIDKLSVYHGGGISPGVDMKLKSMHKFTSKLPIVSAKGTADFIGKTTKECMLSGVTYGTIAEIDGIILRYQQYFDNLNIIFCGGGANFFESKIKAPIFAVPNLVLIGLNRVLRFNLND